MREDMMMMKRTTMALFGALLGTSAVAVFAQSESWSEARAPYHVAGNIYYVGTKGIGVYLINTPKGAILLDSATEKGADVIAANIKALGFKLSDVKYLIETHAHYDHVGGTAKLKKATGALLIASAGDRRALETGRHDGENSSGIGTFAPVKVDRIIGDGGKISLGGTTLTAHMTPGHSRGCTSWTMTINDLGKPRKVLFFGSTTVAGNILVGNKIYPGIVNDYRRSFAMLKAMKADIFLTNHPEFADLDEKREAQIAGKADAFVDANALPAFVKASEAAFEEERARQLAAK
jgi:metallo-beta-lactamase class B